MTIVDKIKKSVTTATQVPVYYQSIEQINALLDQAQFPCAYLFLLEQGRMTEDFREIVDVQVFFVQPTGYDYVAVENEKLIDEMKQTAIKWLSNLNQDELFRLNAVTSTNRVYDQFDVVLTGYSVSVTLEETERPCVE